MSQVDNDQREPRSSLREVRMERKVWHEHCMKVYNFHPFFVDSLRENNKSEIERVNFITGLFEHQRRGSICDVGSQEGFIAHQLSLMGYKASAVDSCQRFIDEGRLRYPAVTFYEGFFEDLGFKQEFDYILCTETLEHVCNPDIFMEAIVAALKPGGTAVLSVPVPESGEYLTHYKIWGKKEFPAFVGRHLTLEETLINGKWNYAIGTKGVFKEIDMMEAVQIMGVMN